MRSHAEGSRVTVDKTQELCNLFTSTLSSLSADTEALKQLICLKVAVRGDIVEANGGENSNPNIASKQDASNSKPTQSLDALESLCQIDSAVTELEKKMHVLGEIVAEEQRSLKDLESVKQAAEAQKEVLQHMVDASICLQLPGDQASASLGAHKKCSTKVHAPVNKTRRGQAPEISIARVTDSELKSVSRNTRGRITLMVLNDAVADIEKVCREKYEVLHNRKPAARSLHHGRGLERQYRQQLISHRELQVKDHGDRPWVSEQDLRQSCAFFRSGESTARAILTILRSLQRLKQVPGKKPCEVTYIVV